MWVLSMKLGIIIETKKFEKSWERDCVLPVTAKKRAMKLGFSWEKPLK